MTFITKAQFEKLLTNGHRDNLIQDHLPVVKLLLPGTSYAWLLIAIEPISQDIAFGLCDFGMSNPMMGMVHLSELAILRTAKGRKVVSDKRFEAKYPISVYTAAAGFCRSITDDERHLQRYLNRI